MGMDEYIEKGAAIAVIMSEPPDAHYPHWYADKIKSIPAADIEPVKHGRWIQQPLNGTHIWRCSKCETIGSSQWNYCPKCGAKMGDKLYG